MENPRITEASMAAAALLSGERVLVVDSGTDIVSRYEKNKMGLNCTYCDGGDFSDLTRHKEDYMNAFDAVICPHLLYNLVAKNRQYLMACLVFCMDKNSRLIFSIPKIRNYVIDRPFELWGQKHVLREEGKHYRLYRKRLWGEKPVERWNKTVVVSPSQMFNAWNAENPSAQWDMDNIAIKDLETHFLFTIPMKKSI